MNYKKSQLNMHATVMHNRKKATLIQLNMNKKVIGTCFGALAGIIDVIPMIVQKLTWDANISAFAMWTVIGFLVSVVELKIKPILKGIIIAFAVLLPVAVLVGWKEPVSLIPISLMTIILGGMLGYTINKLTNKRYE